MYAKIVVPLQRNMCAYAQARKIINAIETLKTL